MHFNFITYNNEILGGKPIIVNSRISVEIIMEWISTGATIDAIYKAHNHIPVGSVEEAILYAAQFSKNEILLQEAI